ncbi:DUF4423 domain-containing protein [Bdellovibrio sp. HCB337]|uniref:DUF4423 domain-containing protein n=1 Tax=Bdellovibrio sp. HCB337 TaxID=3394358 RepID=UPI0039A74657
MSPYPQRISPFVFSSHTDYLKAVRDHYGERKKPISLKAWASRLGYASSRSLELIIAGDRLPSEDFLFELGQDLKLSVKEQRYMSLMVKREKLLKKRKSALDVEAEMNKLRPDRFETHYIDNEIFRRVSEWYPLVIRQLALTPEFQKDIAWISKRLRGKVTSSQITSALAEWEGLAFDRRVLYTNEDVPSQAVRTYHKKMLQKAIEAVDEVEVQNREYIAITFKSSKKKMAEMKKTLREMRDQLNADLDDDKDTEVFQLCVALFPHTELK